jgi:outer membrane protein insertion porin family
MDRRDRIILEANVEEKPTGELQLSAGYSSLESFIFQASIKQNNFRGRGQTIGLSGSVSRFSKSIVLSFTEPYVFDKNVSMGLDIYRRDYNNYNYYSSNTATTYSNSTIGFQARLGFAVTEFVSLVGRYTLNYDNVSLAQSTYYAQDATGKLTCSPLLAGRYLCDAEGKRLSSIVGASLIYDNLDNRMRPTRGRSGSLGVDFAGLGGDVRYARIRANASQFYPLGKGFIFSMKGEAGAIKALSSRNVDGSDDVYLTDRFFLGEPQMRGFDIRGIGPRVVRKPYITDSTGAYVLTTDRNSWSQDAVGGKYYYQFRAEVEIPLGSGAKEMGIRPSIFLDAGAVWGVKKPTLQDSTAICGYVGCSIFLPTRDTSGNPLYYQTNADGTVVTTTNATNTATGVANTKIGSNVSAFKEFYYGDRPVRALRLVLALTGTRRSGRSASISPRRCCTKKATISRPSNSTWEPSSDENLYQDYRPGRAGWCIAGRSGRSGCQACRSSRCCAGGRWCQRYCRCQSGCRRRQFAGFQKGPGRPRSDLQAAA